MGETVPVAADIDHPKRLVVFDKNGAIVGWLGTINDNEIELNTTMNDPVKVRLAINEGVVESNLGAISWNRSRNDGQHHEDALIGGRLTANKQGGAVAIAVRPQHGNNNENVREVFYIDDGVAIFRVPIQAPGLGGASPVKVSRFYSDNGRYCYNVQGDPTPEYPSGRIVQYDTHDLDDETQWTPVAIVKPDLLI